MSHASSDTLVEEARETVEGLLEHYDVPGSVRREIEPLCEAGEYVEALDVLVRNR